MSGTIFHQLRLSKPIKDVMPYLTTAEGITAWWDHAEPTTVDGKPAWKFMPGDGSPDPMLMVRTETDDKVVWECISNHVETSPAFAWTNTKLTFDLRNEPAIISGDKPGGCELYFTHSGWDASSKYFGFCNFAWGQALANLEAVLTKN